MQSLWDGLWSSELVLNKVKSPHEVELIQGHGIKVTQLKDIVVSLEKDLGPVPSAAGADFVDLIQMGLYAKQDVPANISARTSLRQKRA
jgi:hypothetical protein